MSLSHKPILSNDLVHRTTRFTFIRVYSYAHPHTRTQAEYVCVFAHMTAGNKNFLISANRFPEAEFDAGYPEPFITLTLALNMKSSFQPLQLSHPHIRHTNRVYR